MAEAPEGLSALQKIAAAQTAPAVRFNTELVRSAFEAVQRRRREARRAADRSRSDFGDDELAFDPDFNKDPLTYGWIRQMWTDHIIVTNSSSEDTGKAIRIPYTVESPATEPEHVKFGDPVPLRIAYVAASARRAEALSELVELRNVAPKERESLKGEGHTLPGTTSYPIKSLKDLQNAIQAYGRAKESDRARLKSHLLREARRLNASDSVIERIKNLGKSDSVKASALDRVRSESEQLVALARVRTMAGSRRYRKPIGAQLGSGAPGGEPLATVAKTGSKEGAGVTSDKLRNSIKDVAREKTYKGGKVFGDIGNEGKLKSALTQIERLPDAKRGEAAAEVVKAAQALGLTSLVPSSVKRLYRQYIAQGKIDSPSKAPKSKGGK